MFNRTTRTRAVVLILLLFGVPTTGLFFTNCSPMAASQTSSSEANSQSSTANNPPTTGLVDPNNPYLFRCLSSSDGARVANDLLQMAKMQGLAISQGLNSKISSLDWKLQEDLLLTFDSECINRIGTADPIFNHVRPEELKVFSKFSMHVAKKETVTDLQKFTEDALNSECLISTEKDIPVKISADPIATAQMHLFTPQGTNPTSLKHAVGLIQGATNTSGVIDNILTYVGPTSTANQVKVAIVDSGIDCSHPDLVNMIARTNTGGFFFMNTTGTGSSTCQDSGFHGTHVSGLLAAEYNNNIGVMGSYGKNVKIYPYQFTNDGSSGLVSYIVTAINHAVDIEKVDVINLSLSTNTDVASLRNALENANAKGVIVVVAAGNEKALLSTTTPRYPAMYSTSTNGVVTVGSIDIRDNLKSTFTNYSPNFVDVMAPGSNGDNYSTTQNNPDLNQGIVSTVPLATTGNMVDDSYGSKLRTTTGGWLTVQGTSMAAPVVSGAMAAVVSMAKSKNVFLDKADGALPANSKTVTPSELKAWLRDGSPTDSNFTNFSRGGAYLNMSSLYNFVSTQIQNKLNTGGGNTNLTITTQPINRRAVVGEAIEFSVAAISSTGGAIEYQWFKGNTMIAGATSSTLRISNIQSADAGTYKARVTSGARILVSNAAELNVGLRYCQ